MVVQFQIMDFVKECWHPDGGGFGPHPGHDPHLLYTLSAVQVAAIYDSIDDLDVDGIVAYIRGLQQDDGSFFGDAWGEVDTRFSF